MKIICPAKKSLQNLLNAPRKPDSSGLPAYFSDRTGKNLVMTMTIVVASKGDGCERPDPKTITVVESFDDVEESKDSIYEISGVYVQSLLPPPPLKRYYDAKMLLRYASIMSVQKHDGRHQKVRTKSREAKTTGSHKHQVIVRIEENYIYTADYSPFCFLYSDPDFAAYLEIWRHKVCTSLQIPPEAYRVLGGYMVLSHPDN